MCFFSAPAVSAPPPAPPPPPPPPPPPSPQVESRDPAGARRGEQAREAPRPVSQAQQAARLNERRTALVATSPGRATLLTSGRGVLEPGNSAKRMLLGG